MVPVLVFLQSLENRARCSEFLENPHNVAKNRLRTDFFVVAGVSIKFQVGSWCTNYNWLSSQAERSLFVAWTDSLRRRGSRSFCNLEFTEEMQFLDVKLCGFFDYHNKSFLLLLDNFQKFFKRSYCKKIVFSPDDFSLQKDFGTEQPE